MYSKNVVKYVDVNEHFVSLLLEIRKTNENNFVEQQIFRPINFSKSPYGQATNWLLYNWTIFNKF